MDSNTKRILSVIDRDTKANYSSATQELNALYPALSVRERQNVEVLRRTQGTIEALNAVRRGFTASN